MKKCDLRPTDKILGPLDDAALIRRVIARSLKRSKKSRAQIADEMSASTGRPVTERMLNAWAAESREDNRFPCELERAFCLATGDSSLLRSRLVAAGLCVISKSERAILDIGKSYVDLKRRERRLEGTEL